MKRGLSFLLSLSLLFSCESNVPETPPAPDSASQAAEVKDVQKQSYIDPFKGTEVMSDNVAVIAASLYDSKYFAVNEKIISVSYEATSGNLSGVVHEDGTITSSGRKVTVEWNSEDPVVRPVISHGRSDAALFVIKVLPGTFSGKFTVVTDRYMYCFTKNVAAVSGQIQYVDLDFAAPDTQPKRKVGVLGDSISSYDGALCNPDYSPWYPAGDPNVGTNPTLAIDSKVKTYWWKVINEKMQNGVLETNSSWSGTKVVHELKAGRTTGKSIPAGFVDRAYDFSDPDIIFIHGGTNDQGQSSPLGDYDFDVPMGQLNELNFRSAYVKLIKMLQMRYDGVQLILLIGDTLNPDYQQSIISIARHFNIPYVDFVGDKLPKARGSHPNAEGHRMMADKIYSTCKDYLP